MVLDSPQWPCVRQKAVGGAVPPRKPPHRPGTRSARLEGRRPPIADPFVEEMTMSRFSFRPRLEQLGDRALPSATLSITDVAQVNPVSGQTAFQFTVNLSKPTNQPVSVNYAT